MHMADDRLLLSMRVGNVRSKTILNPTAKMLLAMEIEGDGSSDPIGDGQPLCLVVCPSSSTMPRRLSRVAALAKGAG